MPQGQRSVLDVRMRERGDRACVGAQLGTRPAKYCSMGYGFVPRPLYTLLARRPTWLDTTATS